MCAVPVSFTPLLALYDLSQEGSGLSTDGESLCNVGLMKKCCFVHGDSLLH